MSVTYAVKVKALEWQRISYLQLLILKLGMKHFAVIRGNQKDHWRKHRYIHKKLLKKSLPRLLHTVIDTCNLEIHHTQLKNYEPTWKSWSQSLM